MANDFCELRDASDNAVFINVTQIVTATFYVQDDQPWVSITVSGGLGQVASANRLTYSGAGVKRLETMLAARSI